MNCQQKVWEEALSPIPTWPKSAWKAKSTEEILADLEGLQARMLATAWELDRSMIPWSEAEHVTLMAHRGCAKTNLRHQMFLREQERARVDKALKVRWGSVIRGRLYEHRTQA